MYNRVGRGLLIVGRQIRQKFYENTSKSKAAVGCKPAAAIHSTPGTLIIHRGYCNKTTDDTSMPVQKLKSLDEEAEEKLRELLAVPENLRMKNILDLEINVLRENGDRVPVNLKPRHWFELLKLNSPGQRKRYLAYAFGIEKKKENQRRIQDEKNKKYYEKKANPSEEEEEESDTTYKLGKNSMFLRFYPTTMNRMYNNRLMKTMLFGQQLVLDCGYEKYMTRREVKNCARQLQLSFATNRVHDDPFDLYFCNTNIHGDLMKYIQRFIPPVYNPDFPLNIKTESYLDVFDKKQLIYLTPHCTQEMNEFDHDAVYIIGAFVDKSTNEPVSSAKAKREGLKMLKFPLDRYLEWGTSSGKNLTINQVVEILLDLRLTGSWEQALKNVPRRKLLESRMNKLNFMLRRGVHRESSDNLDDYTRPLQEIKLKERFIYKPDRSHSRKVNRDYNNTFGDSKEIPQKDFSIQSRAKFKTNWNN